MIRSKPAPLTLETGDKAGKVACAAAILVSAGSSVDSGALVEVSVVDAANATFTPERTRATIEEYMMLMMKEDHFVNH